MSAEHLAKHRQEKFTTCHSCAVAASLFWTEHV